MTNPTKKKSPKPKWRKSPPELIELLLKLNKYKTCMPNNLRRIAFPRQLK